MQVQKGQGHRTKFTTKERKMLSVSGQCDLE